MSQGAFDFNEFIEPKKNQVVETVEVAEVAEVAEAPEGSAARRRGRR
jgi:hypothetical protein